MKKEKGVVGLFVLVPVMDSDSYVSDVDDSVVVDVCVGFPVR